MNLERTGSHPLAVLIIPAVLCDFADVDFGIEVGGKRLAVISGIAIHNVEIVHFREMVLSRIGGEHARHTRVEAAAEDCRQSRLFEAFAVSPLP